MEENGSSFSCEIFSSEPATTVEIDLLSSNKTVS